MAAQEINQSHNQMLLIIASVTIGQVQYVVMVHSGGDGCFVFTVHSRWIRVALATSRRCGSSRQYWWRTLW